VLEALKLLAMITLAALVLYVIEEVRRDLR
jgi:hypothetical protein